MLVPKLQKDGISRKFFVFRFLLERLNGMTLFQCTIADGMPQKEMHANTLEMATLNLVTLQIKHVV